MIEHPNEVCSDFDCEESGYYWRWIDDVVTGKRYSIYLCDKHKEEFDKYHPIVYFKKGGV